MKEIAGKAKGGLARAASMTKKQRKDQAKKAAASRWSGDIKSATHGSDDHPLKIGDIEIPCYVLEDETRVLSQRGTMGGLSLGRGTGAGISGDELVNFLSGKSLS